jgi:N-formylglutamate amidohydrolase
MTQLTVSDGFLIPCPLCGHKYAPGHEGVPFSREAYHLHAAAIGLLAALYTINANAAESAEWIRRVASDAIARAVPSHSHRITHTET